MKDLNQRWQRLLEAARQAPVPKPEEMPFGFDTRVVNELRTRRAADESLPWNTLLRGALVCSALIMLLSVAASYRASDDRGPGPTDIADSAIRMSMLP